MSLTGPPSLGQLLSGTHLYITDVTETPGPTGRFKVQRTALALVFLLDLRQESHISQASLKLRVFGFPVLNCFEWFVVYVDFIAHPT